MNEWAFSIHVLAGLNQCSLEGRGPTVFVSFYSLLELGWRGLLSQRESISSIRPSSPKKISWGQLFNKCNLEQNHPDLEIPFFAIQDQVISLTFYAGFSKQLWIGST